MNSFLIAKGQACPDCGGLCEAIEWTTRYVRVVCEDACRGENSFDTHMCAECGEEIEFESCPCCDEEEEEENEW